jgi:hypothetical protein
VGSNPATPTIPTHHRRDPSLSFGRAFCGDSSGGPIRRVRAALLSLAIAAVAGVGVAACASTQETPLSPNMVRIDVDSPAAPFVRDRTLRRAAELTLWNGYSAFRLDPIYVESFDRFGVIVVMLHAGDPRSEGAFDAADVLRQPSW